MVPVSVNKKSIHLGYLQAFFHFLTVGKSSLPLLISFISAIDFTEIIRGDYHEYIKQKKNKNEEKTKSRIFYILKRFFC
jgi:hypothetical protein